MNQPQYGDDDLPYTPNQLPTSLSSGNLSSGKPASLPRTSIDGRPTTLPSNGQIAPEHTPPITPRGGSFSGVSQGGLLRRESFNQQLSGPTTPSNGSSRGSTSFPRPGSSNGTVGIVPIQGNGPMIPALGSSSGSNNTNPPQSLPTNNNNNNTTTTTHSQQYHHQPTPQIPPSFQQPPTPRSKFFKIVLIGDVAVGKTSMLRQLIEGEFSEKYIPTSGLDMITQSIKIPEDTITKVQLQRQMLNDDGGLNSNNNNNNDTVQGKIKPPMITTIHLQLWDGGARVIKSILPTVVRDCIACLLVYDVSSRASFEAIGHYLQMVKANKPDALILLIANKCDLYSNDQDEDEVGTVSTIEPIPEEDDETTGECEDGDEDKPKDDDDDDGEVTPESTAFDEKNDQDINNTQPKQQSIPDQDESTQPQDDNKAKKLSQQMSEKSKAINPLDNFVTSDEGQSFALANNLPFIQISSKDGNNIRLLFSQLCAVLPMLVDDDDEDGIKVDDMDIVNGINNPTRGDGNNDPHQASCLDDSYCSIM